MILLMYNNSRSVYYSVIGYLHIPLSARDVYGTTINCMHKRICIRVISVLPSQPVHNFHMLSVHVGSISNLHQSIQLLFLNDLSLSVSCPKFIYVQLHSLTYISAAFLNLPPANEHSVNNGKYAFFQ